MRKAHAQHNEKLCDFLLKNGGFNDWVVTTAFYSAVHYLQHEIFPLTIGTDKYSDLNDFFRRVAKIRNHKCSKHSTLIKLTYTHVKKSGASFKWLFDACMNSRYNNYHVSDSKAQFAKTSLEVIKKNCKK
jgi:hypothetical protein